MRGSARIISVLVATGFLAAGFAVQAGRSFAQAPGGEAPPPPVTVETVEAQTLPVTFEYAGRVASSREVEVRSQVSGILLSRHFDEGSRVQQGDLLFSIDPKQYEAEVARAQAQLAQADAQLAQAQRVEARARRLAEQGASSQATLDDAIAARELAEAEVVAARAQLQIAELSLDYATVEAPAGGVTSLEQVPEGSLLANGDLLTRITQLDPINVNFSAADTEAANIRELVEGSGHEVRPEDLTVRVVFGDGSTYGQTGTIDFTASSIDAQTGTILSRAVLPNPEGRLLPGQFVRVAIEGLAIENAITVPNVALMQNPQGVFVYIVNAEGNAVVAPIDTGRNIGDRTVVTSGLESGDRVITEGVIKVRPDAPVNVTETTTTPVTDAEGESPSVPPEEADQTSAEVGSTTGGAPTEPASNPATEEAAGDATDDEQVEASR